MVFRNWAVFAKKGAEGAIMSAELKLPWLSYPVILNATADFDPLLDHVGATLVPMPKVRNYSNLTVRVLRSNGIGKTQMRDRAEQRFKQLGEFVRRNSEEGDNWLVVTHKDTEAVARLHLPPNCTTVHWGSLDGLNNFNDCNKAILFGLSYRAPEWSSNMYFALRGLKPDAWTESNGGRLIKQSLEDKAMTSEVLQAMGRPRSRKVSDEFGNCLPTTIYVTLPKGQRGRVIEEAIKDQFPSVVISSWEYSLDAAGQLGSVDGYSSELSWQEAVLVHMDNQPPGQYTVNDVAKALGLSPAHKAALKDGLKKKRGIYLDLAARGIAYVVEGEKRGAKSYLVKRPER